MSTDGGIRFMGIVQAIFMAFGGYVTWVYFYHPYNYILGTIMALLSFLILMENRWLSE